MKELFEQIHNHRLITSSLCAFILIALLFICITVTEISKILKK
jgi:hypothetical protein